MDYRAVAKGEPIMTNLNNEFRPTCACGETMKLITHAKGQTFVCDCPLSIGINVDLCTDCTKIIPAGRNLCEECSELRRAAHLAQNKKRAYEYFEGKSKEEALEGLCKYANSQCLSMYDTWIYQYGVEKYGITRADYYNDYDELTEEAKRYIGDNWKPNTGTEEERFERLKQDLERSLPTNNSGVEHINGLLAKEQYRQLGHYASHYKALGELLEAVRDLSPRDGGRYVWEL